ncbi:Chemoreceptor zinc-binding domain-containing protein [Azospirillaceae bacterium]|nr:hypothetical protein MTCCP1_00060 [uncultured bacterium]
MDSTLTLDVNAARLLHIDWLMQLEKALAPGSGASSIKRPQSDSECTLGHWLHTVGRVRYSQFEEIKHLISAHKTFHRLIDRGISQLHQGEREKAQALLHEARQVSKDIIYLLTFIELEIVERERKKYLALHPFDAIFSLFSGGVKL